jgi:hypothetical protein
MEIADSLASVKPMLPFLIPLVILDLGLIIFALVDLIRRKRTKGPKWVWLLVILFISTFGPILYLILGREEDETDADDTD